MKRQRGRERRGKRREKKRALNSFVVTVSINDRGWKTGNGEWGNDGKWVNGKRRVGKRKGKIGIGRYLEGYEHGCICIIILLLRSNGTCIIHCWVLGTPRMCWVHTILT